MRIFHVFLVTVCVSSLSFGQIPNAGFEFWTTDPDSNRNPLGWQTTNSHPMVNVEPAVPGCKGTYAMKVKTVDIGFPFPGVAILETAIPFSQAPRKFTACVKSKIMPGDQALIIVALLKGDSVIAATDSCTFKIDSTISQFTYLEFPLALQSSLVPDSVIIMVASGLGAGIVGTELIIDEIAFTSGAPTDVVDRESHPATFSVDQNYPNPFNSTTSFRFHVPEPGMVTLTVWDVLGREVARIVHEELPPGGYVRSWSAGALASGAYLYQLRANGSVATKRLHLIR